MMKNRRESIPRPVSVLTFQLYLTIEGFVVPSFVIFLTKIFADIFEADLKSFRKLPKVVSGSGFEAGTKSEWLR